MKPARPSFASLAVLAAVMVLLPWGAAVRAQDAQGAQNAQDSPVADGLRIESVAAQQQDGGEVLTIVLNRPLAVPPSGFATTEPARITFDLDGVLAASRSTVTVEQGNLQAVNLIPVEDRTRVVLHLKQPADYKTELQGNAVLVSLQTAQVEVAARTSNAGASGQGGTGEQPANVQQAVQTGERKGGQVGVDYDVQKLSLNFQDIELRALLQVFADFTNINIVTADSVQGSVTVRMQDVPWDKALDVILKSKGLDKLRQGNVLWIAPREEIVAREKQEREARAALEALEPLATQAWMLNYAKAQDVARQLSGAGAVTGGAAGSVPARILSARGSAIAEVRTNQLFVTDVADRLEQVRALIARLDVPVRQVLIEARIVEAADTFSKALGVRLGGAGQGSAGGTNVQLGSYNASAAGATAGTFVNLPAMPPTGSPSAFAVSIFGESAARFLNLEISALEADGRGKIISSPRVITADKVKAVIEQGTELPYQVAAGASGATAIAFRKANLMLEVTPQITPEGSVILDLNVSKDTVGQSTPAGFAIDTKHVQTQVLVENGGTVVIGGIYLQEEAEDVRKVPVLGDVPGLGVLFRSSVKRTEKREMLVFITPRALGDQVALLR